MKYNELCQNIKKGNISPIYFLYGDENYFIDKVFDLLENTLLTEAEKGFNYDVFYAPEVKMGQVVAASRGYPMMAQRRVVVVKELHRTKKDEFEVLTPYIEKPATSTVLILIYKDKKLPDGRSKFMKALKSNAIMFESNVLYESEIMPYIQQIVKDKNFTIDSDALSIIVQSLGTNLQLIESELQKIFIFLGSKKKNHIDKEIVFEFINIDKDFNVFQLIDHLGVRDFKNAYLVIEQMSKNFKDNPPLMLLPQIYKFYLQLGILKQRNLTSEKDIANFFQIKPFFATKYKLALQKYSITKIKQNLLYLLEADLSLKGILSTRMGEIHIMKTLILKLLT